MKETVYVLREATATRQRYGLYHEVFYLKDNTKVFNVEVIEQIKPQKRLEDLAAEIVKTSGDTGGRWNFYMSFKKPNNFPDIEVIGRNSIEYFELTQEEQERFRANINRCVRCVGERAINKTS